MEVSEVWRTLLGLMWLTRIISACDLFCCAGDLDVLRASSWIDCCAADQCEIYNGANLFRRAQLRRLSHQTMLNWVCRLDCCAYDYDPNSTAIDSAGLPCCSEIHCRIYQTLPNYEQLALRMAIYNKVSQMDLSDRAAVPSLLTLDQQQPDLYANRARSLASGGMIAGIVFGATFGAFLLTLTVSRCRRRYRNAAALRNNTNGDRNTSSSTPAVAVLGPSGLVIQEPLQRTSQPHVPPEEPPPSYDDVIKAKEFESNPYAESVAVEASEAHRAT